MATWNGQQPPEGRVIEAAAKASGRSIRFLAANARMSDTQWRNLVRGWRPGADGEQIAISAPPLTLARMAWAVGLKSQILNGVGRADAAEILEDLSSRHPHNWQPLPEDRAIGNTAGLSDALTVTGQANIVGSGYVDATAEGRGGGRDEIDLIYASRTMTAREKLLRIRQVLELRSLAEAEEVEAHEEAPAEAGAESQDASLN